MDKEILKYRYQSGLTTQKLSAIQKALGLLTTLEPFSHLNAAKIMFTGISTLDFVIFRQ